MHHLSHAGLVAGAAVILLAGCSAAGSQPAYGPNATVGATVAKSWMSPDAKKKALLYVSDAEANVVDVYSYPGDKLKGQLTGFAGVQGLCTDKKGNVWIANQSQETMLEYAHGGTQPIATLDDSGYHPSACAVNTKTGDLAVANLDTVSEGAGNLAIFKNASGSPQTYSDSDLTYCEYVGYDTAGDVFVDGQGTNEFELAELPSGGSSLETISVSDVPSGGLAGGIQWDGKYITVGDATNSGAAIYQLVVSGSSASVAGTTTLTGPKSVGQYDVLTNGKMQGKTVIAPELGSGGVVGYFAYPAGGSATKNITGLENPLAVAISKPK